MATIILVEKNLETNMQTDRKRKNEIKPKNGHNTDIQNPIIKKEKKIEKHPHRHKDNLSDNKCDKKNKKPDV